MPRGRKPVPPAILKMQGTYRQDKQGGGAEIPACTTIPPAPDHIPDGAKAVWDNHIQSLIHNRIISVDDFTNFESYCILIDRMRTMHAELSVPQLCALANSISKLGSDFGLTPAARQRISPIKQEDTPEEKAKYFA